MNLQTPIVPQLIQKEVPMLDDNSGQTHFIHELKPVSTTGLQIDSSNRTHDRENDIMLDPRHLSPCLMGHDEISETEDRETARSLVEMRNVVSSPIQYSTGGNSFTAYYYYWQAEGFTVEGLQYRGLVTAEGDDNSAGGYSFTVYYYYWQTDKLGHTNHSISLKTWQLYIQGVGNSTRGWQQQWGLTTAEGVDNRAGGWKQQRGW